MEITMHLTLGLTHIVNGSCLVQPLDWLALQHRKVFHSLKALLDQVVHPLEYFHSIIVLYAYQYYNEMKYTFKPYTCYCHIHLACMSVHCERKMHCTNYLKIFFIVKILCVLILLKYEPYKKILHRNFPDLRQFICPENY